MLLYNEDFGDSMTALFNSIEQRLAEAISEQRLWSRLMTAAQQGAIAGGGVNRQALTREDGMMQAELAKWAERCGFSCFRDEIGNFFIRRAGMENELPPVMIGSHLDSQPTGGKFDGAYGVLAACEVLEALNDLGIETKRPIEAVAWMNEEGSRFTPGAMGSGVFVGHYELTATLAKMDANEIAISDALATVEQIAPLSKRALRAVVPHSYIEVHIEQGPILEREKTTIGVVTGVQGICRFAVEIRGHEAHAGTTPRRLRSDAMSAAVLAITRLEELTADPDDILRFTVGSLSISPNSPNTVPGQVNFSIDLRHPSHDRLEELGQKFTFVIDTAARERHCEGTVKRISFVRSTVFDPDVIFSIREAAEELGYSHLDLPSGAGHDAMHIAKLCPAGMIFIPCAGGVSHNVAESAMSADIVAGARVLAIATLATANR